MSPRARIRSEFCRIRARLLNLGQSMERLTPKVLKQKRWGLKLSKFKVLNKQWVLTKKSIQFSNEISGSTHLCTVHTINT